MKNLNSTITTSLLILLSIFISCKKSDQLDAVDKFTVGSKQARNNFTIMSGLPTPPLDWENISFMPTPPNSPAIPVPWQGGLGGAKIDDDIIFDYQSANGWELVYNTFTPNTKYDLSYFMLYNKYRGVLRIYTYIAPGGNYPSSN